MLSPGQAQERGAGPLGPRPVPLHQGFSGEGLLCLPAPIPSLPREAGTGSGRHRCAKQKEAEERGAWAYHTD